MREYETIYLLKPDIPAEQISGIKDKVSATLEKGKSHILAHAEWGKRKLAYDVHKNRYANYVFLQYLSEGPQVAELERILKYDDSVLKFLTVKVGDQTEVEARLSKPTEAPLPPEELHSSHAGGEGGSSRDYGEGRSSHERKGSSSSRDDAGSSANAKEEEDKTGEEE